MFSHRPLQLYDSVYICSNASYSFQMLGLMTDTKSIRFVRNYPETMMKFTIKFHIVLVVNNSRITVTCITDTGSTPYDFNFKTVNEATGTYVPSSDPNTPNYLNLPALSADNAGTMIFPSTVTHY